MAHKKLSDYPEFLQAVKHGRICYLFGAGMSRSLCPSSMGWLQWLESGVALLGGTSCRHDLHDRLVQAAGGESASDLVRLAGDVILCVKDEGLYDGWMARSFSQQAVRDLELARTLAKIPLAHDLVATTNYDRLLEDATGLGTLTASSPGDIFKMIDKGSSEAVIHLHGAYAPEEGIDDIVAGPEQYESLVRDEGAQFVQRLLGSRTVVFVGCGATMDDPNIAQLIRFMEHWLDIKVPYYFLLRHGETPPALPENVRPIVYGDNYGDLRPFLDDLVSLKLTEVRKRSPLIGRVYEAEAIGLDEASRPFSYHFSTDKIPFIGRTTELKVLESFLAGEKDFSWVCVTGQGGAGKSRLAYELMGRHRCDWFCFIASEQADAAHAGLFSPFANTLVVFDCVRGREKRVAEVLCSLSLAFTGSGFRLRAMLIEREIESAATGWLQKLERCLDEGAADDFACHEYCSPINLGDLSDKEVLSLIGEACRRRELPADEVRDRQLLERYRSFGETLRFRPLYVRMYVEAWIDNGRVEPEYTSFLALIQDVLQREQEKWLGLFCGNYRACNATIRLIVRACAGGRLTLGELPGDYHQDWEAVKEFIADHTFSGMQRDEFQKALLAISCHDICDGADRIAPELPGVIKEYMLVYYVPAESRDSFARELWKNSGEQFSAILQRALKDFRENEALIEMMRAHPEPYGDPNVLLVHLAYIRKELIGKNETPDELEAQTEEEYAFWHDMPSLEAADEESALLNLIKTQGLMLCGERFGAHSLDEEDIDRSVSCCLEVAEVPVGKLEGIKLLMLSERANLFARNGRIDCARRIHDAMEKIGGANEVDHALLKELEPYCRLAEYNVSIMDYLLRGDPYAALEKAKGMRCKVDLADTEQVRLFCSACYNVVRFSFIYGDQKRLVGARALIDEAARIHPAASAIRALALSSELEYLQLKVLQLGEDRKGVRSRIEEILAQCEGLSHVEEFYGCWGAAAIAYLNVCDDDDSLRRLSERAETLLCEAGSTETPLAQAWMKIKIAEHKSKGPIPASVVQDAHSYYMRQPESEGTRAAFFDLLHCSSERDRVSDYFDVRARTAMLQDALTNPMFSEEALYQLAEIGITEEFLEEALVEPGRMDMLPGGSGEPMQLKKPGRNDPCPCGSGKKYKKCCMNKVM